MLTRARSLGSSSSGGTTGGGLRRESARWYIPAVDLDIALLNGADPLFRYEVFRRSDLLFGARRGATLARGRGTGLIDDNQSLRYPVPVFRCVISSERPDLTLGLRETACSGPKIG
jgi:hypothetical protein